jgi:hypothetical protein
MSDSCTASGPSADYVETQIMMLLFTIVQCLSSPEPVCHVWWLSCCTAASGLFLLLVVLLTSTEHAAEQDRRYCPGKEVEYAALCTAALLMHADNFECFEVATAAAGPVHVRKLLLARTHYASKQSKFV